jgi:hypothetical protein
MRIDLGVRVLLIHRARHIEALRDPENVKLAVKSGVIAADRC